MAWYDTLLDQGYVPAGTKPKVITEPGGTPGFFQTDKLSTMLRGLDKFQKDLEAKQKKRQEDLSKQVDMYKTLREAGYDPKKAYEAVMKSTTMPEPDAQDTTIPKTQREKILDKISRGETLSAGEQTVYDETIKHKTEDDLASILTPSQEKMRERIMNKIAAGQTLTPGEQKIYDEVIKKSPKVPGTQEDLEGVLDAKNKDMVLVTAPDGSKGSIPKKNLPAALKAGFKIRKK